MRCVSANGGECWQTRKNSRKTAWGSIGGREKRLVFACLPSRPCRPTHFWPTWDKADMGQNGQNSPWRGGATEVNRNLAPASGSLCRTVEPSRLRGQFLQLFLATWGGGEAGTLRARTISWCAVFTRRASRRTGRGGVQRKDAGAGRSAEHRSCFTPGGGPISTRRAVAQGVFE